MQYGFRKLILFYIKVRNQTTTFTDNNNDQYNYFTSKLEIKPQPVAIPPEEFFDYFTSKLEIKPQPVDNKDNNLLYYFTSKLEIKPQLVSCFCT